MKLKAVAAVAITTVLTTFSVAEASPPSTDPPVETQESTTTEAPPAVTVAAVVETEPPPAETEDTASDTAEASPEQATSTVAEQTTAVVLTTNPNQVSREQTVVVTATVVADANTGGNTIVAGSTAGSSTPAEIDSGDAAAVGSEDANIVTQGADITLEDQAVANVIQVALIINVGVALANSGYNAIDSTPGGPGITAGITTGDADATGLDIGQYITQAAREEGDENTDAHANQLAISLWLGVGTANTGTNGVTGTGAGSGGAIGSGDASATGNVSVTDIEQYAELLGEDTAELNVTQRATVLNVGFALANSGINDISGVAGGLLSADPGDDNAYAQDLFAMLLPALLQSYGYGPAAGAISSGDATAVGNDSDTFIRQIALAASSGDGVVDIVQQVLVANVGAAGANSGGNTLGGGIATLEPESASAIVMMAAFMSEMLALVHAEANGETMDAVSRGIDVPFQGLLLRLDASFEGLDTTVEQGGAQANLRQVTIVVSLGLANANTGHNETHTEIDQGNVVNELQAGDSIQVLAVDAEGNVIGTGDADAANEAVVVICQRLNADDVECLAPPTTTSPPTTSTTAPVTTTPSSTDPGTSVPSIAGTSTTLPPAVGGANPPSGFGGGHVPAGTLPATGGNGGEQVAIIGAIALLLGGAILVATRRRTYP